MFPWTESIRQNLRSRAEQQHLPHAILISGPRGVGKQQLIASFAQALLCEQRTIEYLACGSCRACNQFLAQSHPDYHGVQPEEDSTVIKIDQIRQLVGDLSLTRHYHSGYRIAVINPAEAMNTAAANSLLKSLEEPPPQTVFFLISHQPSLLPATIRSRCQRLNIGQPEAQVAMNWLKTQSTASSEQIAQTLAIVDGAPVLALQWLQAERLAVQKSVLGDWLAVANGHRTATEVSAGWLKAEQGVPIQWLYHWAGDLIRIKSGLDLPMAGEPDYQNALKNLAQRVDLQGLFTWLTWLIEATRLQQSPVNQQLLYESILLEWARISTRPKIQKGVA